MSNCCFIVPNTRYEDNMLWSVLPSRGLLSLAACLRQEGHSVNYIDADFENLSDQIVLQRVQSFKSDIVGITMNTFQADAGMRLAQVIKRSFPCIKIIVGGPHPSALRKQILTDCPEVDIACIGEGEETIVDVAACLERNSDLSLIKGISYRRGGEGYDAPDRTPIQDLDVLPYPAYDLVHCLKQYPGASPVQCSPMMHVMASRGCPYQCIFCTKSVWGSKVRFRKPEKVIDEVEFLSQTYGIKEIFFQDDTMNLNRSWFFKICDEIIRRSLNKKMVFKTPFRVNRKLVDEELLDKAKEAGFWMIFYGVESGNQHVLDTIKKGTTISEIERAFFLTHKAGIKTIAAFMVGNVGDTRQTIQDSVDLAKKIRPDVFGFSVATPLPGTEFYNLANKNGWISHFSYKDWSQFHAVSRNADLTAEEIAKLRDFADEEVRKYLLQKNDRSKIMYLKDWIKKTPVIGPLAVTLNRYLKKNRQQPSNPVSMITSDYSQMSVQERREDLNRRYSKGNAYPATVTWDTVRMEEIDHFTRIYMNPWEGKEILELGCAAGGAAHMVSGCKKYVGTDLSEKAIDAARDNYGGLGNVTFERMDATDITYGNESFDMVLAREVIEHLPDIDACLKEVFRVLRRGGVFILTSPNKSSLHLRVARFLGQKEFTCSFDHINEISYEVCCQKLKDAGFVIEDSTGIFLMPFWGVTGIDSHVRHLTDNDPAMVEMLRDLGRKVGPEYGFCYAIKASRC